LESAQE
jgi:hypothetical protein